MLWQYDPLYRPDARTGRSILPIKRTRYVFNEHVLSIRRCQHREMVLNTSCICYYRMSSMTEKLPFGLGEMPRVHLPCLRRGSFKAENMRSSWTRRWLVWGFTPRSLGSATRYLSTLAYMRHSYNGSMTAFQAVCMGSIPIWRSIFILIL